ncbi:MAG: hypothetical protein ACOX7X_00795 [Methanosarcina flavescens]|uniref:Uncharacterized protein n=1 Tax=Methanosarcina flavescens TaxID=1715806 RepID=A0A660HTV5_9EURY|nr:hypothetical protein [Methanosarcina flavescens]AYK15791.1 hypothetical protein AOB57_011865 [Methanosarcina flavescens]NLK31341.1 hypothetical protein [Methanosarcina flavescens]
MKNKHLILLILLAVVMAVGCTESSNEKTNSQSVGNSAQTIENSSQVHENNLTTTDTSTNQDAEWISVMQAQSDMIQTDLAGISSNQDTFDAEGLAKSGQTIVDDTQKAIDENDNYTVSPALEEAKEHWGFALRNYNMAGQFTVIGANAYLDGDDASASTNFEKATTFFNSGNADVNLTVSYIRAYALEAQNQEQ